VEEANEIIDEVLNRQSAQLWKWRCHLIKLLTQPLTSKDDAADGLEYARSLETQGEAEAYLQAYAALLADRREVMTAERTLLAAHDVKEKRKRGTQAAMRAELALLDEDIVMAIGDIEPQPQDEALKQELNEQRKALLEDHNAERAMRSIMVELTNIAASIRNESDPEKYIAGEAAQSLRELLADQGMFSLVD
jgi:E3 ubiquitin-protein ligase SHPRH